MPVSITASHALSATTPDNPQYEIQPQHWNSGHAITAALDIAATEISGLFSNANGVSFSVVESKIQASVATNYQSTGNYLTTAALSNHSHGNPALFLTNITGTTASASNGLTLSLSGNAAQTVQTQASGNIPRSGFTTTTVAGAVIAGTNNTDGFLLGVPAYLTTAQPVGAYLTTARASNDAVGLNTALTANGVSWTVNSSGLSLNVPAFLTTAQPVGAYLTTARASNDAVGLNTALTANGVAWTVNSSGLSLNVPAFLTTARASNDAVGLNTALTANGVAWTVNSGGISLNVPAFLTTARGSTDAVGLNTAQSNVTWTANSSGLSLDARGYAGTGTSATNASITLNSNGLAISVAAPGGGAAATHSYFQILPDYVQGTTAISTPGKSTVLVQPFFLPQAMSASYIRVPMSVGMANSGSATTAARSWTVRLEDTYWVNFYSLGVGANSRSLQHVTGSSAAITFNAVYHIGAASNNQSCSYSLTVPSEGGVVNYTTSFGLASASFSFHTTILSNSIVGNKWLDIPFAASLSAGAWWVALQRSSSQATTSAGGAWAQLSNITTNASLYGVSQVNVPILPWGVNTSASTGAAWQIGLGAWTTDSNGRTSVSMALSHIVSVANEPMFPMRLVRQV